MKQSLEKSQKKDKPDMKKMLRYTTKKILWLVNYSLSFFKKRHKERNWNKNFRLYRYPSKYLFIVFYYFKAFGDIFFKSSVCYRFFNFNRSFSL